MAESGLESAVKRYRADARRCCLLLLLALVLAAIVAAGVTLALHFTLHKNEGVDTLVGRVKGRVVMAPGDVGEIEEYLGIPFAKPPVGQLRYSDPERIEKLPQDPYDATDMQNACIQYLDETFGDFPGSDMWNAKNPLSEDCLYLNLWVPHHRSAKLPVMVWIYGGGFYGGSTSLWVYDGKALAAYGDVIVASFNYRVGSFGFLSTGDGIIKGNFGMKDQVMALQWIQDNIASFGGDPDRVTIFGESSGASSAGLHSMSNNSEHLFQRAIYESGSPDTHWSLMTTNQAKSRSKILLEAVNCTQADSEQLLQCLRALPYQEIHNNEWVTSNHMVFPWAPTVDKDFLMDTPHNLLKQGKVQRKDTLLGVNRDEGTFWLLYTLEKLSKDTESLMNYTDYVNAIDIIDWDLDEQKRLQIKEMYAPGDKDDLEAHRDQLDKVCGDRSFTCPTKDLTDIYANLGIKTYFYYLTYRASTEVWPPWMGVIHGAEIQWVFGMPLNKSRGYTEEEVEFSKTIMSYWVNFAKHGNPHRGDLPEWPEYTAEDREYVEFHSPSEFTVRDTLREKYCAFWNRVNADAMANP